MKAKQQAKKKAWTKPEIRQIVPSEELLAKLALAQGSSVESLREKMGRGSGRIDRAA